MEHIKRYILAALFFSIPLYPKLTSLCIILHAVITLVAYKRKNFSLLWKRKELMLLTIIYSLMVIGLFYTIDFETGISKLETQASLLVLPMFFIGSFYGKEVRRYFLKWFNWGLLATVLICFLNAFRQLISGNGIYTVDAFSKKHNIFFYQEFSNILNLHPTYFSLYLGFAIFYLTFVFKTNSRSKLILRWLMTVIFFVALFLTSSKAGVFSFISILFCFQLYRTIRMKKKSDKLILFILILGSGLMFIANPLIYKRSLQAFKSLVADGQTNESTSKRFSIWHIALKSSKEKPFLGYGTGSANQVLNDSCITFFNFSSCEGIRNKNTHNQYLNLLLSNGIVVVLLFLMALFLAFKKAVLQKDALYFLFTLYLSINFFFESLLERERGVVFFMLIIVFLSTTSDNSTKKINE